MDSFNLIIFGITSNLSQIKLIPALYDLAAQKELPDNIKIIGIARDPRSPEEIKKYITDVLHQENRHHQHEIKPEVVQFLTDHLYYLDGHVDDPAFYPKLTDYLAKLNQESGKLNTIYYLATYPNLYAKIFENLQQNKMNSQEKGWVRLMIEKPIGHDLSSAKELNQLLLKYFSEDQIYRLDHYLGKETLQNILTFRFANNIFEHLINKDYIDHIQISALEDFGIGQRGGYFDEVGALKDVGQNHILQMIAFATMDKPMQFNNEEVTKERLKVIQSLQSEPRKIIFGQYQGYHDEPNVDPNSQADTFFAFKTEIKNDRFSGVPIYVRAGKKLNKTVTEISIVFKKPLDTPFTDVHAGITPNILIYRIQPNEGIILNILTKKPGFSQQLEPTYMQYCYKDFGEQLPDAYEKLIADAMRGDQTFFNDAKEVEAQWTFIDPLVAAKKAVIPYEPATYGPQEAEDLIKADGRLWLDPSMLFCKI